MNIFVLDTCPIESAKMLCDKHIVKMPLESTQMLSSVWHRYGHGDKVQYKEAFKQIDRDKLYSPNEAFEKAKAVSFAKFDETGNGKLNYVEFCGMMNRRQTKEREKASGSSSGATR